MLFDLLACVKKACRGAIRGRWGIGFLLPCKLLDLGYQWVLLGLGRWLWDRWLDGLGWLLFFLFWNERLGNGRTWLERFGI